MATTTREAAYLLDGNRLDKYRRAGSGWTLEWSFFGADDLRRLVIAGNGQISFADGQGRVFVVRNDGDVSLLAAAVF
jgi:hypothetical protein